MKAAELNLYCRRGEDLLQPLAFAYRDPETGDLWLPDVGQNVWEEINFQPADSPGGENYGWPTVQGTSGADEGYTEPLLHGPCRNPWDTSRTPGG